jgi:hypothetical protein
MFKQFKDLYIINNMDLEYYLLCKKNFDNIIANLTEIIENYDNIFSYTDELDMVNSEYLLDKFQPIDSKEQFKIRLNYAKYCRTYCYRKAQQACSHEFVKDTIDITPDRSENITYCSICEYTKK